MGFVAKSASTSHETPSNGNSKTIKKSEKCHLIIMHAYISTDGAKNNGEAVHLEQKNRRQGHHLSLDPLKLKCMAPQQHPSVQIH